MPRATQTIPPAVRRAVLQRDQHRCQVPGCRHATFVDVHHLRRREAGGGHQLDNLLTLCSAHHRAVHRGELLIERRDSGRLEFRQADGLPYGELPSGDAGDGERQRGLDATRAFGALRGLGFAPREIRDALRRVSAHVGGDVGVEGLIRSALERLTRNTWEKAS